MSVKYGRFEWNHCPICGDVLISADDGQSMRPHCPPCERFYYSNPAPAACCFLTNDAGELLLVQRSIEPRKGLWTLPGGFVEMGETTDQAALRELEEETALRGEGTSLLGVSTISSKHGGVIVIGYKVERWEGELDAKTDAMDAAFFSFENRPEIAFEVHQNLLRIYDTSARGRA